MGWFCLYGLLAVLANTLRTRSSREKSQSARSRTCRSPAARTTLSMCQCAMMRAEIHQNPWIQSWYMDVSENRAPYFQMACFEKRKKKSPIQTAIQCGILASRFRWKPSIAKSVQTSTDLAQRNDKKLLRKLKKLKSLHQFKYLFNLRMQARSLASKCVLSFARRLYNFLSPCQVWQSPTCVYRVAWKTAEFRHHTWLSDDRFDS